MLEEIKDLPDSESRFASLVFSMVLNTMGIAAHLPNWFDLLRRYRTAVENDAEMQHLKSRIENDADGDPVKFYGALFSVGATGISSVQRLEEVINDLQKVDNDERRMWLQGYETRAARLQHLRQRSMVGGAQTEYGECRRRRGALQTDGRKPQGIGVFEP